MNIIQSELAVLFLAIALAAFVVSSESLSVEHSWLLLMLAVAATILAVLHHAGAS